MRSIEAHCDRSGKPEQSSEASWRRRFPRPVDLVLLPLDHRRPPVPSYVRGTAELRLPGSSSERLEQLCSRLSLPPLAVMLAAMQTVLFRYTAQDTFVVGAAAQSRKEPDGQLSGFPLLPIRMSQSFKNNISGQALLQELARELADVAGDAEYPLRELQSWAGVRDAAFGTRLFNVAVCLADLAANSDVEWPTCDLGISEYLVQCDVSVIAKVTSLGVMLNADFDADVFDQATVERLLGHMGMILDGLSTEPAMPALSLPMLTLPERQTLLVEWNSSRNWITPYPTLHQWFEAQVERTPDNVALTYETQSLTFAELNQRANRLAHMLRERGVGPDVIVGLCLDRSLELVIGLLGILKAGGAYLPIDPAYPKDRLAFMLEDAEAPFLVTRSRLANELPLHQARILCVDDPELSELSAYPTVNPVNCATADTLAYVIYTSGTTGKPKGTLIAHRNVTRLFSATDAWYEFKATDVWTLFHSTAFDFSVWEIWGALLYGGRVVIVPFLVSRSPESFYELLAREGVTVLNQTPSAFRQLIQTEAFAGQRQLALRYVIFGGEALELQSLRPWFDRHGDQTPRLINMYGITETTVHVTYRPLSKDDLEAGSVIGVPIPDLQVYILDEQQQPVPVGVPGEMYVGGAGLARGYLRRPELTAERFIPNHLMGQEGGRLYRTGDLARFLPGRDIEYLGRIDQQVKIRGFRIELGEIESVLCRHSAVREAVVVAREDVPGVKTLVAYLVSESPTLEISELREHLKRKVPDYMVPATFVVLDRLPLTNNGKIDRNALPVPECHRPELADRYVPPRTPTEKQLVTIWSNVLRLERVGVQDNFFELGGDSILSIQAIAAARQNGLMLTAKQMFTYHTIAELARQIDGKEIIPLSQDVPEGNVPLTPIQRWFFEQNLDESHHYNQALLLDVAEPLDREILAQGLEAVSLQHDALRFRYVHDTTGWHQFYATGPQTSVLQWANVADLDETARSRMIESMTISAHESLDLEQGPLWRVLYFDGGPDRLGQLLIVVHHLAVDGVSWRPIVEDLEMAYLQSKAGQPVRLSPKTTSFKAWSRELRAFAACEAVGEELAYWKAVTTVSVQPSALEAPHRDGLTAENREGTAETIIVSLSAMETEALLYTVPGIYNTQINDVLLTALARAWQQVTGSSGLFTNLEGHGREQLITDLDLSRTVGWFTSLFPVRLELPVNEEEWDPGQALKSIKEQLRRVPRRGIGYGLLRYLRDGSDLAAMPEPNMVFNYFGQFDQVLSGSKLFRFSSRSTGPWHSPNQQRRHALEINGMVKSGRLELSWTYCPALHSANRIERLTSEFLDALKQLISHCQLPGVRGRTPSDYPLSQLDQPSVDRLVAGRMDIEDIYRLSPIQSLFFSVNPGSHSTDFDQWQCTLRGPVDLAAFQRAWHETIHRHTVLRSSIHGEGLNESVQVVHRHVELPWIIEDWRGVSAEDQATQWSTFLKRDREHPLTLTEAPVMRFALFQLTEESWRFVWSVSALLLDGWSWPIVFRDVSKLYASFCDDHRIVLDPVRPYRDYMEWLNKSSSKDAQVYWQRHLKGFRIPTSLRSEVPDGFDGEGDRYPEHVTTFSTQLTADLHDLARRRQVTLSTLVQAAWALLLMRQSGGTDVVFGAAFSGRPVELRDAAGIVGPFVNNIPIRVQADAGRSLDEFLKQLQSHVLEVGPYQFMPLLNIQECSELPWKYRPFESLVVFQNYLVDEAARRFGADIEVEDFKGPIHTNYPVLLLAEPGPTLRLTLIRDGQRIAKAAVERWGSDLALLMMSMPQSLDRSIGELRDKLSEPSPRGVRSHKPMFSTSQQVVPPQTDLESSIALVWQKIFGLDRVSVEDNLFDLGGHSLLLITMHSRLRMALKRDFPLVTLFTYPTIRTLAGYFKGGGDAAHQNGVQWRHRAQQKKAAMKHMRSKWGKKV